MNHPPELFGLLLAERDIARALHPDQRIAQAAARRDGIISRPQLLGLGLSASAIGRRVDRGILHPRHTGVYVFGHQVPTRQGALRAAIVAHGPAAVLSHWTAACEHQLVDPRTRIDVTVPGRRAPARWGEGIRLHLTRRLTPEEVLIIDGLPFTSVARTLADLAAEARGQGLQRAWNRADGAQLIDVHAIDAQLRRGRSGTAALRALRGRRTAPATTESVLEDCVLELCERFALPTPVCQWPLGPEPRDGRADFVFPDQRVAVEVDGRAWHAVQAAFERDREKDLLLREAGFDPHRYTYRQVTAEPQRVAAALRRALRL